jgi:hypothetical protein
MVSTCLFVNTRDMAAADLVLNNARKRREEKKIRKQTEK